MGVVLRVGVCRSLMRLSIGEFPSDVSIRDEANGIGSMIDAFCGVSEDL